MQTGKSVLKKSGGVALAVMMALSGAAVSCQAAFAMEKAPNVQTPNVLVIIGDDMGVETLKSFGVDKNAPTTKNLDSLAANGVSFDNFWSQSVCSPTRATILTGRYGFRTEIGGPIGGPGVYGPLPSLLPKPEGASTEAARRGPPAGGKGGNGANAGNASGGKAGNGGPPKQKQALSNSEFTLPMAFDVNESLGYKTAAIGKWHLADTKNGWLDHPTNTGFDHFSGLMGGFPEGYFSWIEVTDGKAVPTTGYTPINKVDNSIKWIKEQENNPWFLWLAFNLPHDPIHLPPTDLLQADHSDLNPKDDPKLKGRPYFDAMVEAMDSEIGRLLEGIDPAVLENTYVIFLGDNGTERGVIGAPFDAEHSKGTLYQGGINVPMIISGPGVVKGERSTALVNSVDLFATVLDMTGISVEKTVPAGVKLDSVSVMPYLSAPQKASVREFAFADYFGYDARSDTFSGDFTIRNSSHKLIKFKTGKDELYNLSVDPYEKVNLLGDKLSTADQKQYNELIKMSTDLRADASF